MTASQWRLLDDALAAALELPADQRHSALESALTAHPDLLVQARELLAAESTAAGFLERPGSPLSPGSRLGPWQLIRELGRGGMGVVWLAQRADGQTEMLAAIKFLDSPFATPESRRRFIAEKTLLARLNHPHIARLLDAGLDHHSHPNFILEFVDGLPLTQYTATLPIPARVRLLIQVAQAVQHAHANLVIHRDLKPANILVTPAGDAKLLDFGIARLSQDAPAHTRTLFRALSLDYASPEQIRGEEVSTATDVFSLGIVFFEVLTAQPARQWTALPIAQAIRDSERFRLPSAPNLHPDLRAILDKATEHNPSLRYPSAAALAADLRNFLEQRPVEARPRSAFYTLRRFIGRNRLPVAAALLALIAIVALAIAAILAGMRADSSRRIADSRLRQLETANAETQLALQRAEAQSRLASAREQDMLDMSFALLTETYRELRELPGATAVRARLIESTLTRLESLRKSGVDNRNLSLLLADAHGRLAEVSGGPNENLGSPETAIQHFRAQVQILSSLRTRQPDDPVISRLWAEAVASHWLALKREKRSPDPSTLLALKPVWSALLKREPGNPAILRPAGTFYFSCATGLGLPRPLQLKDLEMAARLWASEEQITGGGEVVWRNLALAHKYIAGTLSRFDRSPRQLHHAETARGYDLKRLDRNPSNVQARMDLTFDLTNIGDYHLTVANNPSLAATYYREALRIRQLLLALEPANPRYLTSVAYPARFAAWASLNAADFSALATDLAAFQPYAGQSILQQATWDYFSGELAFHHGRSAEACTAWRRASTNANSLDPGTRQHLSSRLARCPVP